MSEKIPDLMRSKRDKWSQFSELQLKNIVHRRYPNFGEIELDRMDRFTLQTLLDHKESKRTHPL